MIKYDCYMTYLLIADLKMGMIFFGGHFYYFKWGYYLLNQIIKTDHPDLFSTNFCLFYFLKRKFYHFYQMNHYHTNSDAACFLHSAIIF
jgi:hypothetical protein